MEVALYVRVSTTRQQQTQTIEQQLARLRAHVATQPDWHLAEEHIYRDDGYSGAKLNRPGLDRLRDRAALAAFERVLLTAPDRLARNYVHQILLIEELAQRGCEVEFLDRPMSQDPHDQLLLQIRGAVAEYERTLITDRMRRGRQAKLRSGQLLPWSVPPYGYVMDPERPRDPQRLRLDPVKAAVITQIFAWYTAPQTPATLYGVAKRLTDDQIPTPRGGPRWNVASVRGILRSPVYTGTAYSERTRPVPARIRRSALRPVGPGYSHRPAPPEEWIAIPVPAIVSPETFAAAQARLSRNTQMARRNNTTHDYLLRGLVSCGQCQLACLGRTLPPGYHYYLCRGRTDALRAARGQRCTARYTPARALDELVWQDLCRILTEPALITHELARAHGGAWLPQALQARRKTLRDALTQLERQQARLLEVYLAEIVGRDEFERKRQEVMRTQDGLTQQLRQLEAQAQQQVDIAALAQGLEAFCRRLQPTLDQLTFAQRRQLVELLIDHVIVTHDQVEIRYVVPTGPKGETTPFCHLRLDYLHRPPAPIHVDHLPGAHLGELGHQHFRLCRPRVSPWCAQDHGDSTQMP
jgi:site-specific DNA recombinase